MQSQIDPTTTATPIDAPQQAATAPGTHAEPVTDETATKLPFKEQVKGYAKVIAGKTFRNEDEVKLGEAKLAGELDK